MADPKIKEHRMENEEIPEGGEKYGDRIIYVENESLKKLENFWYYNKWKVLIGAFLVILLTIFIVQMVTVVRNDVTVIYTGPAYLPGENVEEIQNILSSLLEKEVGEERHVGVIQYWAYSAEQIESIRAETDEDGNHNIVNTAQNSENYEAFYTYLMTGDTALVLVDPWLYEELLSNERLAPMNRQFNTVPPLVDEAGYGIRLGDTEIYQYYDALKILPEDTVICFLEPYVFGKISKDEYYAEMQKMLRAIVNFQRPD